MSGLAAIEHERAPVAQRSSKPARISPAVRKAVHLLITGECKTQKAAAERVGISPVWLCIQLKKPATGAFIASATRQNLAQGTMRAGARLLELIDASSEHVSLDASKHVLAIEGIRPPDDGRSITINNTVQPGYIVNLSAPQPHAPDIRTEIIEHDQ